MNERINEPIQTQSQGKSGQELILFFIFFFVFHFTYRWRLFSPTRSAWVTFLPHWSVKTTEFFGLNWEMMAKTNEIFAEFESNGDIFLCYCHYHMNLEAAATPNWVNIMSNISMPTSDRNIPFLLLPNNSHPNGRFRVFCSCRCRCKYNRVVRRPALSTDRVPDARSCAHWNSFRMENGHSASLRVH